MLQYIILSIIAILFFIVGIAIRYFNCSWLTKGHSIDSGEKQEKIDMLPLKRLVGNLCFVIAIIMVLVVLFVNISVFVRKLENKTVIENRVLKIQGMYGTKIALKDINRVFLISKFPKIKSKIDGLESGNVLKGKFVLDEFALFGKAQLYIQNKNEPYILIGTNKANHIKTILINFKDKTKTKKLLKEINTIGAKYNYKYVLNEDTPIGKPVIYLYPTTKEKVSVKVNLKGDLGATYPTYDNGWNVMANTDGSLVDLRDNAEYSYLFWEGTSKYLKCDFSKGFVVKGEDTEKFLREKLSYMGLNPHEYNDFIVYWLPQMYKNKYNLIHFAGKEYEDVASLQIEPKPDSVLRVYMEFKPLEKVEKVDTQELKSFKRKGFTVIEWGGSKIN